ncbi:YSIRK-type signal peptide-containing protein [Staphylococcus capitis]|uniref:YSIRK-type signal peptide-containing protein n=1 Tax=Staphylococcus capitis TaxID=29388 RepID=UPI001D15791D|nr:YSIRK-type signal peptide-containing protein [Staphylococcus capitis]MCC3744306.1 YSIRK-type signal peptide-containing protein [Staphylococcus capitis]
MNKKTLFSIRKLSVGIASVAIGGLLFISSGYSAHAAEDDNPSNSVDNTIKDTSGSENQDSTNTAGNTENNNNEDNNTPANTASGEQDQNSGNVTENGNDSSKQDGDQSVKDEPKDDNGSSNGTAEDQDKDGTIVDNKDASKQDGDQDKEAPKEDNGSSEATNKESGNTVEGTTHKVAAGETIEEIAKEHNTTVNQIAKDNGISNPNLVVAGTDLVINQPSSSHVNNDKVTSESHNANSNELPETGEDSGINVGLTGGLALAAGAALVASRRRKEQE